MASLQHTDLPTTWFGREPVSVVRKHEEAGRSVIDYVKENKATVSGYVAASKGGGIGGVPWPKTAVLNRNTEGVGVVLGV